MLLFLTDRSSSTVSFHLLQMNSPQLNALANPALAERINGWAAMIGFWALVGAYVSTGQIIPGIV